MPAHLSAITMLSDHRRKGRERFGATTELSVRAMVCCADVQRGRRQ
jgi:hypothetical protein